MTFEDTLRKIIREELAKIEKPASDSDVMTEFEVMQMTRLSREQIKRFKQGLPYLKVSLTLYVRGDVMKWIKENLGIKRKSIV